MTSFRDLTEKDIKEVHRLLKKGWSKAKTARELKMSRPTLYKVIKFYPEVPKKPKLVVPKYVQEFEESETIKTFKEAKKFVRRLKSYVFTGREAWRILDKKDPITWTEKDYLTLWHHPQLRDPLTGKITFNHAVGLRQWMTHCKQYHLPDRPEFTTKGLKRPKGLKKTHYIKTLDEMGQVILGISFLDTLVMFRIGTESGARFSSIALVRPQDIDYTQKVIMMREPKVSKIETRYFTQQTLNFLRQYIVDLDIQGNERCFKKHIGTYNRDLKKAGRLANIPFNLTTHTAMKHTFVSQASAHGVSLEIASEQTGTEPSTLQDFYLGINIRKLRYELLGEPYPHESYGDWIGKLDPIYRKRYKQLLTAFRQMVTPPKKEVKRKKKKRPVNWGAVRTIIKKYKGLNKEEKAKADKSWGRTIPYWKKALTLHNKGLTDAQIREKMKKK